MKTTKILPENYHSTVRIDLKENTWLAIILNLAGIPLFFISGWFFLKIIAYLRVDATALWGILGGFQNLIIVLTGIFFVIVVHEIIHGIFFWVFTHSRPKFAFKLIYAYAAAPEWYIPRNQYLVIGLAPLFLISIFAILLFLFLPPYGVALTLILASFNVAGAVGDIAVTGWLMSKSRNVLINDRGDAAIVFQKT